MWLRIQLRNLFNCLTKCCYGCTGICPGVFEVEFFYFFIAIPLPRSCAPTALMHICLCTSWLNCKAAVVALFRRVVSCVWWSDCERD